MSVLGFRGDQNWRKIINEVIEAKHIHYPKHYAYKQKVSKLMQKFKFSFKTAEDQALPQMVISWITYFLWKSFSYVLLEGRDF